MNPGEVYSYTLDTALKHGQIAALGSAPRPVTAATTSNHAVGVVIQPGDCAVGEIIDVAEGGTADVLLGGAVSLGAWVGSDANGKGVAVTSGRAIGYALESGVSGDLIEVRIQPTELGAAASAVTERVAALETSVDTAETGLLARVGAVEAAINTESTGILARLTALETPAAGSGET